EPAPQQTVLRAPQRSSSFFSHYSCQSTYSVDCSAPETWCQLPSFMHFLHGLCLLWTRHTASTQTGSCVQSGSTPFQRQVQGETSIIGIISWSCPQPQSLISMRPRRDSNSRHAG